MCVVKHVFLIMVEYQAEKSYTFETFQCLITISSRALASSDEDCHPRESEPHQPLSDTQYQGRDPINQVPFKTKQDNPEGYFSPGEP